MGLSDDKRIFSQQMEHYLRVDRHAPSDEAEWRAKLRVGYRIGLPVLAAMLLRWEFPAMAVVIFLGMPLLAICLRLFSINPPYAFKGVLFASSILAAFTLISDQNALVDFVGESFVSGYSGHLETRPVLVAPGTEAEHYTDEEVLIFSSDAWYWSFLLEVVGILYYPVLILVPYVTWRMLSRESAEFWR